MNNSSCTMRRLEFRVLVPYCGSHWEHGDMQDVQPWPLAPAQSFQWPGSSPSQLGRGNGTPCAHTQSKDFLSMEKKETAFSFPFSEAQLSCNTERNGRLVRDRGILAHVHLSLTSAKNYTFTILYQMKPHLCEPQITPAAVGPSLTTRHNSQKTSL